MARVSQETIDKLNSFLDSLPAEARSKCALCNETLTHIVKSAEVETGAGTATVTRALSAKINEGAAPSDRVSDNALRQRVLQAEGVKCSKRTNKTASTTNDLCALVLLDHEANHYTCAHHRRPWDMFADTYPCDTCSHFQPRAPKGSYAMDFVAAAISQLGRIEADDAKREEALRKVIAWAQQQLDTDGAIDQEASLPPAKSERRDKALDVLKPLAERAITAAIETGLDKTLHLNDRFTAAYSTGAGAGRVLVAEVAVKKMNGT